ncbi:class I SAM-dependent methyltransferase [Haladaptatus caseinilyticus]|uniref:class I SAM-dependent methyltransferase n=1 Tax=Haladaptatus caseinilyticus TaxID=2993314 RepID=UPI00224ABA4E|nr:class I SAM-dependent methyltransferase [Haladaptatus caseinilyticus]
MSDDSIASTDDLLRTNRNRWDELAEHHPDTEFYDIERFLDGGSTLRPLELDELGEIRGQSLLHLQCHFGLDTLSWAREGATVTGVDFSGTAIEMARELADEADLDAEFVRANIYDLPDELDGDFDVVFTSYGVLAWLPDLESWADVIEETLVPGGTFYMAEIHPLGTTFADLRPDGTANIEHSYFEDGATRYEVEGTYADWDADIENTTAVEWQHGLGEVVTALASAGLKIEFVHEFPFSCYQQFPAMEQGEDGWWRVPDAEEHVPFTFSVKAKKAD